mgnify:FL=1
MIVKAQRVDARVRVLFIAVALALTGGLGLPIFVGNGIGYNDALAANNSGLYVNVWKCQSSYGRDLNQLLANCTIASDITFEVIGQGVYGPQTFVGGFSLSNMPNAVYVIKEYIPQGYVEPVVFCGKGPSNSSQTPPLSEVITYDGVYEVQLGDGEAVWCNWFNVPPTGGPPTQKVSGLIRAHGCPPGFDAISADIYELAANCQGPMANIGYTVTASNFQHTVISNQAGWAEFNDVPTGQISVNSEMPTGYGVMRAFCNQRNTQGESKGISEYDVSDDGTISFTMEPQYESFDCDWFYAPAPRGVSVTIVKYYCPEHVGYNYGGFEDYSSACTELAEGVTFKLDSDSTGNPGDKDTDANGQASWSDLEADHYYLSELPEYAPQGYGRPVAFCGYYDPAATQDRQYERYDVSSDYRIEFDLADGQAIACVWFNIVRNHQEQPTAEPGATEEPGDGPSIEPSSDGASFTLIAYTCDPGYDPYEDEADPEADCPDTTDGLPFRLFNEDDEHEGETGDEDEGTVVFSDLDEGIYTLQAELPEETALAFILACESDVSSFEDYPFYPFALVGADGTVRLALLDGENLACSWYNVPAPETELATIIVEKQWCAGPSTTLTACESDTGGVVFILTPANGDGEEVTATTDDEGRATFEVPAGTYTLEEEEGTEPCFSVSNAFDDDGNLVVEGSEMVEVTLYNCGN